MANINNYAVSSLNANDKLLASDGNTGKTKNVSPEDVADLNGGVKIYRAFLTQNSTFNPLVTIAGPNTIGSIVWTRVGTGTYEGTLANAFAGNVAVVTSIPPTELHAFSLTVTSSNVITLATYFNGVVDDGLLNNQYIEIRVY